MANKRKYREMREKSGQLKQERKKTIISTKWEFIDRLYNKINVLVQWIYKHFDESAGETIPAERTVEQKI